LLSPGQGALTNEQVQLVMQNMLLDYIKMSQLKQTAKMMAQNMPEQAHSVKTMRRLMTTQ